MFLRLYNFLRGYLVLSVSGFQVPRFINLAARKDIYMWNVCQIDGRTHFCCSVKGFKLLRRPARKSGCRVKIVKRKGLPFLLHRYRKRKFLLFGLLLFVGLLFYLTSFIWLVDITGNEKIEAAELAAALQRQGVAPGLFKRGLLPREIEGAIMADFPGLSFANLSVRGTRALLSVVEVIHREEPEIDRSIPADIVAAADGIVHEAATETGRPLVRPGDVVSEGDVLVSGELRVGAEDTGFHTYFVRAAANVTAKRFYEYQFDVPLTYIIKSFTGNVKRNYGIILFSQKVRLGNVVSPFENYDLVIHENRVNFGHNYPLPLVFVTETFAEFVPETVRRSVEEAEIIGRTIVDSRLKRELPEGSEIAEAVFTFEEKIDALAVNAVVTVIESIGIPRPIEVIEQPDDVEQIDNTE